jgi:hypothetical protein
MTWTMDLYVRRLGPGLAGLLMLLLAAGCELGEGDSDAGDLGGDADVGTDTPVSSARI